MSSIFPENNIFADVGDYMNERNLSSMCLLPTTEHEVYSIVKSCKNKMSKDSDDLSMSLLKDVFSCISGPFTYICNLSFKQGFTLAVARSHTRLTFESGD